MCKICDNLIVGECLPILESEVKLENGYVLSIGTCSIYKNETGAVEIDLYHDLGDQVRSEKKLPINYCPLCGRKF